MIEIYNGIREIEEVINYIEDHITEEIDCNVLASKMRLSVYEFRRIFSFIVGYPISEYIRKRRLSLAAIEIMTGENVNLLDISEKYGYTYQSAFTRAFCDQHGVSPSECMQGKHKINIFTHPKFTIAISGRETVPFRILKDDEFFINGFSSLSPITDSCCCENVWSSFYESRSDKALSADTLYVSYSNFGNEVNCCIGERGEAGQKIPAARWACFDMNTVEDDAVNEVYSKILYEWLPSAGLIRDEDMPTVEVYPVDMTVDGFEWEIRIPIK